MKAVNKKTRQTIMEEKVDDLEKRIIERSELLSGFGEPEQQSRKLQMSLKFFDAPGRGSVNYQEFFAAMTKFNLVGVQREIEALFNRYDEYVSGFVDYYEFALRLYGLSPNAITLDKNSRSVVNKIKEKLVSIGGPSGYHYLRETILRIENVESGLISREDLNFVISDYGIDLTNDEWDILYDCFDVHNNGKVSL